MGQMRSPNFPVSALDDAIEGVRKIYDKNRKAVILRDDAAKDMGYSGLTGRSLQVLGSLNQFDLIENVSKGQVRVTQTAEDILHGFPDEVKRSALLRAGRAPTLFQSIYERFEGEIPGENAVRSFLIQNGFTNEGADKALKNFFATNRHLEVSGVSESYGGESPAPSEESPQQRNREEPAMPNLDPVEKASPAVGDHNAIFWNKGALDFSLSSAGLIVAGATNSATDLKAYISKLETLVALLPDNGTEH